MKISLRHFTAFLTSIFIAFQPVMSGINNPGSASSSPAGPTGGAQVGLSASDFFGGFINAADTGNQISFNNGVTPAQLDVNGYPGSALTSTQQIAMAFGFIDSQTGPSTNWVFKWTPAGDAVFFLNNGWSNAVATGCSVTTNSSTTTVTMTAGTPCRVTFNWFSLPGNNLQVQFRAANYAANSPKMVLCRASDEAAIASGQVFTPEYLASYAGLHLRTIRGMSWLNSGVLADTNQSLWAYRSTLNSLGYENNRFPPGVWGGTISGTNAYTVALPTNSSAGGWVDGEVIQGNVTNASTGTGISITGAANNGSGLVRLTVSSTAALTTNQKVYVSNVSGTLEANGIQTVTVISPTLVDLQGTTFINTYQNSAGGIGTETLTVTGKTGGTVFIAGESGSALHAAFSGGISSGLVTFVYNSLLGVVLWQSDGIQSNIPIEAMVNLANSLNVNLWTTIPTYAPTSYATSEASLVASSLNSSLSWYPEYSNEVWNTGFPQTAYAVTLGAVLGISGHGFYSLHVRQIMGAITPAWTAVRSQSTLNRILAIQGFGDNTTVSQRLNSSELNAGTNAKLLAYAGNVNYTTAGQRAADFADSMAYANYFSGALFTNGFATAYQSDASAVAKIQTLATAFNSNASDPTSLATVDNDFRQGTILNNTISSVAGTTINATANGLSNGQIGVWTNSGGVLYTGVALNTPYYVVSAATNSFSVSATRGGAAIPLSGGTGTNSFGILASQTQLDLASTIYQDVNGNTGANPGWESVAGTYDVFRTGAGQPKLQIELYEGALEGIAPTGGQCALMGVFLNGVSITSISGNTLNVAANTYSNGDHVLFTNVGSITGVALKTDYVVANSGSTSFTLTAGGVAVTLGGTSGAAAMGSGTAASAALAAGLTSYKNSSAAATLALALFNQFMGRDATQPLTFGLMAHSKTPSWFLNIGPSQWSLTSGNLGSPVFQTYNGVAAFH